MKSNELENTSHYNKYERRRHHVVCLIILTFLMFEPYTYISYYYVPQIVSFIILSTMFVLMFFVRLSKAAIHPHIASGSLLVYLLSVVLLLFSKFLHLDDSNYYFSLIMYITIAYVFSCLIGRDSFIKSYLSVMRFLCLYSIIITYSVIAFAPFFKELLPSFQHYGLQYYNGRITFLNALFCNVYIPDFGMQFRNYGIFREPGVYQFYLILALIFELFYKDKLNVKSVILIFLTILSTFSAPGIVLSLLLLVYYALSSKSVTNSRKTSLQILITILIFAFLQIPEFNDSLQQSLSKLSGGGSYDSRYGSLVGYIDSWLQKPIFGWGYTEGVLGSGSDAFRQYSADNTNTTFTNFALFGLMYGLLHICGIVRFGFLSNRTIITSIFIAIVLLLSINTQRFIESPIIFVLIFYAYHNLKINLAGKQLAKRYYK